MRKISIFFPLFWSSHTEISVWKKKSKNSFRKKVLPSFLNPLWNDIISSPYCKWLSFKERRQAEFWLNKLYLISIAMPWATPKNPLLQCVVTRTRLCCNNRKVTIILKSNCIHLKMPISTWIFLITSLPEYSCCASNPGLNSANE